MTRKLSAVSSVLFVLVFFGGRCGASVIEPWRPGVSPAATVRSAHSFGASVILAEKYFEVPFKIFYGLADETELTARWGLIHFDGDTGISDMKFAVKHNFAEMTRDVPAVFVEGGVTLPTADHNKGLGSGGVGLSAGWYILKKMEGFDILAGISGEFNDRDVLPGARPPRVFAYRAGAKYSYAKDAILTAEIKGFNNYWKDPVGFRQELYLAPGIDYKGRFPFSAAILIGISGDARKFALYAEKNF